MTYHGKVKPGSPAVRELAELMVTKASVGPMDNNAFLLRCRNTGAMLLVDAADEPQTLLTMLAGEPLSTVVTTHQHHDHWAALADVVAATSATTVAGAEDVEGIPVRTDVAVSDGDTVAFGDLSLRVVRLVGHTPGSIALVYDDPTGPPHVWTGDSLFPGGPGRTTSPADFTSLMDDLETKLFAELPDETWVYPGHGDDTTLGAERPHLPEWRARGW